MANRTLELPDLKSGEWKDAPNGGGLKFWDVRIGAGAEAASKARVTVHYTGWLINGTIFDSSVQRNDPITFGLDQVIQGWSQGVPGMKVGGVRRLNIPSALAYGTRGAGSAVPPNADLIFEIELIAVN